MHERKQDHVDVRALHDTALAELFSSCVWTFRLSPKPWEWSDREMNAEKNDFIIRATIIEEENSAASPRTQQVLQNRVFIFFRLLEQMSSRSYHVDSVSGPW